MAKLWKADENTLVFDCPACGYSHPFDLRRWTWNGSMDAPTFSPSLLVNAGTPGQCHSFVRDGRIEFVLDSGHALAGQTVPLPEVEI